MGLAASFAYLLGDDPSPEASKPPADPSATPTITPPIAQAPQPLPQMKTAPPPSAPAAVAPAAPPATAPGGPPMGQGGEAVLSRFKDPKLRDHAQRMVTEAVKLHLNNRNLAELQRLRNTLREQGIESVIAPNDLTGMDVALECLSGAQDARLRVSDFIEDNPSSPFVDSLRAACL